MQFIIYLKKLTIVSCVSRFEILILFHWSNGNKDVLNRPCAHTRAMDVSVCTFPGDIRNYRVDL